MGMGMQMLAEARPDAWEEGFQSMDGRLKKLGPLPPDRFSLAQANARWSAGPEVVAMSIRVEVIGVKAAGSEPCREVLSMERSELAMETLGMTLEEGKARLAGVQDFVVAQQAPEHLERRRECPHCGARSARIPAAHPHTRQHCFGRVEVPNPRWNGYVCQTEGPKTFPPMRTCGTGRPARKCGTWRPSGPP
jgi:hypothetical protein